MKCLFLKECIDREGCVVILAEAFRSSFGAIQSFLTTLAEATSRPSLMHEYRMTPFSLGAAVSACITAADAQRFLDDYVYGFPNEEINSQRTRIFAFIETCMSRYNLARIVIDDQRALLECENEETANTLMNDHVVESLCADPKEVIAVGTHYSLLLQNHSVTRLVAERCVLLGFPLQQQYAYERDESIRNVNIMLRTQTKPRPYQIDAVNAAAADGSLRSGCIILPCGAGKTLVGIMLLCKVKKPTLILCAGSVSVEQWKNQILEFANICAPGFSNDALSGVNTAVGTNDTGGTIKPTALQRHRSTLDGAARIACLTGKQKDEISDETDIVLTTYSMLVTAYKSHMRQRTEHVGSIGNSATATNSPLPQQRRRLHNPKKRLFQPYGLLIMDEVHVMPAEAYSESLSLIDAKGVVGLTATYVREDTKIRDLFHIVGPKLYDVSWETLALRGYLANVTCVEVSTPLTRQFSLEYMERSSDKYTLSEQRRMPLLVMLAAANPNKMLCVLELVRRHIAESSKILVFCDHIMLLKEYGKLLRSPVICGETPHRERLMIFSDFQSTSKVNVICLSRVGDVSVNLPSANVVIQVSSHGGSRRQEAQRLGRILRPKANAGDGKTVDAWFYTVISTDTLEMSYAAHRMAFLVDQGYTCRIMEFRPVEEPENVNDASAVSTAQTGDVASMKQERLRSVFRQSKLCCRSSESPLLQTGSIDVQSLDYQLSLLSRVVSSFELDYQSQVLYRGSPGNGEDKTDTKNGNPHVVSITAETDADGIKREWVAERGVGYVGSDHCWVSLQNLVGVDENFVYHEL